MVNESPEPSPRSLCPQGMHKTVSRGQTRLVARRHGAGPQRGGRPGHGSGGGREPYERKSINMTMKLFLINFLSLRLFKYGTFC